MNRYEIRCTEEQTRKALELGAPIRINWDFLSGNPMKDECYIREYEFAKIPTAEQMIGWLEEHNTSVTLNPHYYGISTINMKYDFRINIQYKIIESSIIYDSRKEATLAAIDAALEYLIKKKGE